MKIDLSNNDRLSFFQDLYEEARAYAENTYEKMSQHLEQYKGSNEIDDSPVKAKYVRNITYELVESQVTSYIPNPLVSPKRSGERAYRNAKSIETLLRNKRDELPFESMNDLDERYNPIYGGSVWLVEWDNSILSHNSVGDIKTSCLPPHRFIGQPNIYTIEDMEYCFVKFETTREEVVRKYGVKPSVAEETESDENSADDKSATIIVCYYKDEEDNVCEYVWSGDVELSHVTDYFSRKSKICVNCGKRKELCKCEHPEYEDKNEEYEELDRDIFRTDGTIIPSKSPKMDENGQIVMTTGKRQVFEADGSIALDEFNLPLGIDEPVPVFEPTRLPYYKPKRIPIVIRKNTSQENNLFGQSDVEFIRPQQQAINKIESRITEKLLKAGVIPVVPEDYKGEITNEIYGEAFRADQSNHALFGRIDLQVNISQDLAEAERLYDQAKRILGISSSYQGQADSSAQSGRAKQIQVQQSAGRLDSKRQMKNVAYAEMDRIIFEYYLAYADEPRHAVYRDGNGILQEYIFNRYDFIEVDEAGEYYYDDGYLFRTDASMDVERNREFLWQENRLNFQSGAYGNPADPQTLLIFWQNMERDHYPFASDNVERFKDVVNQMQMQAQLQQQNAELQNELDNHIKYEEYLQGAGK